VNKLYIAKLINQPSVVKHNFSTFSKGKYMSDIIHLLPDSVANQIAAGEVIQRPASAVKELVENAIDAGATSIKISLKEAGKTLIEVIDNGKGMSETDARMCFERHATSKLKKAEDLFEIKTMGFRGEAMASIAGIAQVELKTKLKGEAIGTKILIEGSEIMKHEPCSMSEGTHIIVKNLFYNIPARRNFLKSNPIELRHIIEEFQRQALAHPEIFFSLHNDGNELFHLPVNSQRNRIAGIFGNQYQERLVPVEEETESLKIQGFVGKPQFAKKTRGEQYFFVNKRYIKDPYLNHAVLNAFEELLPSDSFPFYVIFLEIEPKHIDVNVHPTKSEIKFDDEKLIYAILRSAIKRSIGKYHLSPSIDFNTESSFNNLKPFDFRTDEIRIPTIQINPEFNPFKAEDKSRYTKENTSMPRSTAGWEALYEIVKNDEPTQLHLHSTNEELNSVANISERQTFQLHQRFILSPIKNGLLLIDQQGAHERILYERYLESLNNNSGASQQCLFPINVQFSQDDFELVKMLMADLQKLGFDIHEFGKNTIVVHGVPAELNGFNEEHMIMGLLENYKQQASLHKFEHKELLARSLSKQASIKSGKILSSEEMNHLIDELFACELPQVGLSTKSTFVRISIEDLASYFNS
jgi:DNA mismatch repair protein MutL